MKWAALGILERENITKNLRGEYVFRIIKRLNHPQYKLRGSGYEDHDIALLQLENRVKLSPAIRPICVHQQEPMPTDSEVYISGWGKTGAGKTPSSR